VARATLGYIGPYRLLNVVNTGRTSQIWQAYDDGQQRIVGIKVLLEKYQKDREEMGYLRWEYLVGRKVVHPRIIEIYSFEIDRGVSYLAMEWFPAPNLKQRLLQGVDKFAYLLPKIIEQASEALGYFHRQGWVHRDVKPDNFLVADSGDVKLLDLSLAQRSRRGLAKLFAGKSKVQGTRSYMSPEQIRGRAVDQRADLYSFGCMLHELLSGRPPFTGASANELLNKHLKAPPPSLEAADRNVTPEFAQLVRRTLAKSPAARPESFDEFLREFRTMRVYKNPPRPPQESGRGDSPSGKA
jgi:serine/threonine protein kinase